MVHTFNANTQEVEASGSLSFMPPWSKQRNIVLRKTTAIFRIYLFKIFIQHISPPHLHQDPLHLLTHPILSSFSISVGRDKNT